ncbi:hypothetical protein DFP73DRAFT_256218 [Morchella snyderi]|nr:hypothetical protein DFP73DRAFT_256218 [Morchella snyderi]
MSFGFGVGDFIVVSKLSWELYRTCVVLARGAPHEFQLLVHEITTLSQALKLLEEESQDPESTLCNSGEDRIRMVKEVVVRVEETLKELKKVAKKYEKITKSPGSMKKWWSGVKWALESGNLDGLRNKLVYHNGIISLLLVSCGNSSLQRIEASNARLERSFSQIDALIRTFRKQADRTLQNQVVPLLPTISTLSGGAFKATSITACFIKNAELQNRRWSTIGAEEWIQAGRWWLMKAQSELLANHPPGSLPSKQGYTDLIKASWILLDVIQRHPQLNLVDTGIQGDALVLAEAVTSELELLESSGFAKPSFSEIETCNLTIWEGLTRAPSLHPGHSDITTVGPYNQYRRWESAEEQVLFQRHGRPLLLLL